MPINRVEN